MATEPVSTSGLPAPVPTSFLQRRMQALAPNPARAALFLMLLWGAPPLLLMPFLLAFGAGADVLWGLSTTVLLTFAVLSAVFGLFMQAWWRYTGFALLAYLALAMSYAGLVLMLHRDAGDELMHFSSMYSAFFISFFMIHGVTGAVRRIAGLTGLEQADRQS